MGLIVLSSNRPASRFYRGGRRITDFRGEAPAGSHEPEDWIASTTEVFGEAGVGITVLPEGIPLSSAIERDPLEWLGPDHLEAFGADTKLLVKLLDAGQRLPVHAHPDGEFAATHLGNAHGKAEAWHILEGGVVHLGLRDDVDPTRLRDLLDRQDSEALLGLLHSVDVEPGDTVFVPAGQLHAIGAGVFLVEVQEPEDLSILLEWRDFDLDGRKDGHLGLGFDLALEAVSLRRVGEPKLDSLIVRGPGVGSVLPPSADRFFRMERISLEGEQTIPAGFAVIVVLDGEATIAGTMLRKGMTTVVPYAVGPLTVIGSAELLACRPPQRSRRGAPGL